MTTLRALAVFGASTAMLLAACGDPDVTSSSDATAVGMYESSPTPEPPTVGASTSTPEPTATLTPPPPGMQYVPPTPPPQPTPRLPKPTVRHTGESVRMNADGSYYIPDDGDGCTYTEVFRGTIPYSPDGTPVPGATLTITLQSFDCYDGYYHYKPSTGELTGFLP